MLIASPEDLADGILLPQHFNKQRLSKYVYEPFDCPPSFRAVLGNGPATGATGNINLMQTNRAIHEWSVTGTQTILVPVYDRVNGLGLDFAQDQTLGDGHEIRFGGPNITIAGQSRGRLSFTIGTDPAFFARLKMRCSDTSGIALFGFGFFRQQAYQGVNFTNYTDAALFLMQRNVGSTGADTRFQTILNTSPSNTNLLNVADWLDNTSRTFEIRVSNRGKVSAFVDGVRVQHNDPGSLVKGEIDFTFDLGDVVEPGSTFAQITPDLADNLFYQEFECGYLPERGK